jgi:hypothetical protein
MPDISQNNRLEKREALDLALFHKLTSGDPESFVSQFFVLLAHVMKHSSNNEADGTRRQGVIVVPGGLHLGTPWTSTDGATVIPIR